MRIRTLPTAIALILLAVTHAGAQDNTATGTGALQAVTTGNYDTADGFDALSGNTIGSYNTAVGASALPAITGGSRSTAVGASALHNDGGSDNSAFGYNALYFNAYGTEDTAFGSSALYQNEVPYDGAPDGNMACGYQALFANSSGYYNTAMGADALYSNSSGIESVACGYQALLNGGGYNTAFGANTLKSNANGGEYSGFNLAVGWDALGSATDTSENTAVGAEAFASSALTGYEDIAIGFAAGQSVKAASMSVYINSAGSGSSASAIYLGTQGVQTATTIAGIYGVAAAGGVAVYINSTGQLGTSVSSERFKDAIHDMGAASDLLFTLRPVAFRYKHAIDPQGVAQFGLVAEQVEKIDPALVVHDSDGQPYSVRYEQINAMLLNEFLKEGQEVQEQRAALCRLQISAAEHRREFAEAKARERRALKAVNAQDQAETASLAAAVKGQSAILRAAAQELASDHQQPRTVAHSEE